MVLKESERDQELVQRALQCTSLVVFDLDGTLVDTASFAPAALQQAIEEYNYESATKLRVPTVTEICAAFGLPSESYYRHLLSPWSRTTEVEVHRRVMWLQEKFLLTGCGQLFPDIEKLLTGLVRQKRQIAFVSHCSGEYLRLLVQTFALDRFSQRWSCTDEGAQSKGDLVKAHLQWFSVKSATLVGDRKSDVEAAHEAGVYSVGCLYGYGKLEELACADVTVKNVGELISLLGVDYGSCFKPLSVKSKT